MSDYYPLEIGEVDPAYAGHRRHRDVCDEYVGSLDNEDADDESDGPVEWCCTLPAGHGGCWHVAHDSDGIIVLLDYAPPPEGLEVSDGL